AFVVHLSSRIVVAGARDRARGSVEARVEIARDLGRRTQRVAPGRRQQPKPTETGRRRHRARGDEKLAAPEHRRQLLRFGKSSGRVTSGSGLFRVGSLRVSSGNGAASVSAASVTAASSLAGIVARPPSTLRSICSVAGNA